MKIYVPEFGFSAGSETVVCRVLAQWVADGHGVILAAPHYRLRRYRERGLDARVRMVELGWSRRGWRRWLASLVDRLPERSQIGKQLRCAALRDQIQREQATHVFVPWAVDREVVDFGKPTGVMVMDLAWRHYPAGWFGKSVDELDAGLYAWMQSAHAVFPVSDATAAEVASAFPDLAAKLAAVPHGAMWRGVGTHVEAPFYFLTPASVTPNKSHVTLLRAALRLWQDGVEFRLVWVGAGTLAVTATKRDASADTAALRALYLQHAELIGDRLEARGFVTDAELECLYAGACRVVLPSTYEGFGLPVMEAFERGARVICTDIPPFVEQINRHDLADRATLVPCNDPVALAEAMRLACRTTRVGTADDDEADLGQRVEAWTWRDAARRYLEVLGAQ